MVSAVLVLLCVATFYTLSAAGRGGVGSGGGGGSRWGAHSLLRAVVWAMLGVMLAGALVPGVLIGSAWAGLATALPAMGDGPMVLVAAHVARFGVVAMLAGVALWRSEEHALRQARVLIAGDGLRAFGVLVLASPTRLAALAGVAIVGAALSLHEIESAIMVQPPGRASLARQLLEQLHYLQDERTSASVINLGAMGLLMAAATAWCVGRMRDRSASHTSP
jgi:ABC-type spermidine/putrescine transport system permease subunit II